MAGPRRTLRTDFRRGAAYPAFSKHIWLLLFSVRCTVRGSALTLPPRRGREARKIFGGASRRMRNNGRGRLRCWKGDVHFDVAARRAGLDGGGNLLQMQFHQRPLLVSENDQRYFSAG